ncbi:MAG: type II toxin-antitoxin system RelE/ParE family toxin [Treponema brennaborense]|nr:type II toxin-antitoxin system RelE/ParE family toxin [Prevotella sp.]MCM1408923.1 type II toxin-antitoxin system RelE/ParE family toxin [Treponema brennaborense]
MKVEYLPEAAKQLSKLDKSVQKKIKTYLNQVAELENPKSRGKALIGNLAGLWRYRVGDYRILCRIKDAELIITVVEVGHRREIYD